MKGYIQVYTGDGKGKTSAALGLAVRALGRGKKVCIVQFMKGIETGEILFFEGKPGIVIKQFGTGEFVMEPGEGEKNSAYQALNYAKEQMLSGSFDIIILDEINVALQMQLLGVSAVLDFLRQKPEDVEVVLTGRNAPKELLEIADLVTEMREVKHYYKKGIGAREGIEY
ncbi:MAG: cob(I)yrinic acid a,c-diamide adenosyltransferase [Thermoplasmata archaeon]|nr:cob(I)yrinic acid a,c-diamide adenosyltransferase [Thermoplasmata archaeon]